MSPCTNVCIWEIRTERLEQQLADRDQEIEQLRGRLVEVNNMVTALELELKQAQKRKA